jgi:hypothetical protein
VEFVQWLLEFVPESAKSVALRRLFDFQAIENLSFPQPSLALSSPLGTYFLPFTLLQNQVPPEGCPKSTGIFPIYFTALLNSSTTYLTILSTSDNNFLVHLLVFLLLHCTLAKDSLAYPANLTSSAFSHISDSDMLEFQENCISIIEQVRIWKLKFMKLSASDREAIVSQVKDGAVGRDANAYYHARILCDILPIIAQLNKVNATAASAELKSAKETDNGISDATQQMLTTAGFLLPALVAGYSELLHHSKELHLLLNGLVSSISGIIAGTSPISRLLEEGLVKLAALNTMSEEDGSFCTSMKEFRILMLVKTVLQWKEVVVAHPESWILSVELLRLMKSLLPTIKRMNGDFWESTIGLLKSSLEVYNALNFLIPSYASGNQLSICLCNTSHLNF